MATIKLLTNDGAGRNVVPVAGTQVMVGGEKLDAVASVSLDGDPGQPWVLTLRINVDPNTLFELQPVSKGNLA